MDMYCDRIEGSYAEYKDSAAVWHFGDADRVFAMDQANEMRAQLSSLMSQFPIKVS
jgi:trehalose-6-phosphatase